MSNGNNPSDITKELHNAVIEEDICNICKLLGDHNANPDAKIEGQNGEIKGPNGEIETENTPLHVMTEKGVLVVVLILIRFGACVNVKNSLENTPLHIAARKGWESITWHLVMGGADSTLVNAKKQTPSVVAKEHGNTSLIAG